MAGQGASLGAERLFQQDVLHSVGSHWLVENDGCTEMTTDPKDAEIARLMAERRMIVSHATMGQTDGEGLSVNAISVKITALRNELYQDGAARAEKAEAERDAALAQVAGAYEAAKEFADEWDTIERLLPFMDDKSNACAHTGQHEARERIANGIRALTPADALAALSRRDAQMRAEGRKEGLREAAALCDDTAQEALEESGAESRTIWTWFRGQRDAILAAAEREASP